ncbi:hypothetical protein MPSEU_000251900 [Mayamaea pseudoterrestris]|nr:hypothetical protein MPSEU_000251900 [Mayamaea pseudoterrestris]
MNGAQDSPTGSQSEKLNALRSKRDAIMKRRFSKSPGSSQANDMTSIVMDRKGDLKLPSIDTSVDYKGFDETAGAHVPAGSPSRSTEKLSPVSLRHHFNAARIHRRRAQLRPGGSAPSSPAPSPPASPTTTRPQTTLSYASDTEVGRPVPGIRLARYSSRILTTPSPKSSFFARPPTPPTKPKNGATPVPSFVLEQRSRSLTPPIKKMEVTDSLQVPSEGILSGFGSSLVRRRYMRRRLGQANNASEPSAHTEHETANDKTTIYSNDGRETMNAKELYSLRLELKPNKVVPEANERMLQPHVLAQTLSNETESSNASRDSKSRRIHLFQKVRKGQNGSLTSDAASTVEHDDSTDDEAIKQLQFPNEKAPTNAPLDLPTGEWDVSQPTMIEQNHGSYSLTGSVSDLHSVNENTLQAGRADLAAESVVAEPETTADATTFNVGLGACPVAVESLEIDSLSLAHNATLPVARQLMMHGLQDAPVADLTKGTIPLAAQLTEQHLEHGSHDALADSTMSRPATPNTESLSLQQPGLHDINQRPEAVEKDLDSDGAVGASTSFDFRSIHDLAEFSNDVQIDPSWNTHKVYFNEFELTKASSFVEEVASNVLDTGGWLDDLNDSFKPDEEKKEKDSCVERIKGLEITGSSWDGLDPLGWPQLPDGLRKSLSPDNFAVYQKKGDDDDDYGDFDDQNLLGFVARSEAPLTENSMDYQPFASAVPSKNQRIVEYYRNESDETSLEDQSAQEDDQASTTDGSDSVTVAYVGANDDDQEFVATTPEVDKVVTSALCVNFFPTFEAANDFALELNEGEETQEMDTLSKDVPKQSSQPSVLPPPPPPPPGFKSAKRRHRAKSSSRPVPLIAPPTAEKFKSSGYDSWTTALESRSHENAAFSANASDGFAHLAAVDKRLSTPVLSPCLSDTAVMMSDMYDVEDPLPSKCELLSCADASDPIVDAPASAGLVLHENNFAERVDVALSAAVFKFEDQVALGPSDIYDKPVIGAYCSFEAERKEEVSHSHRESIEIQPRTSSQEHLIAAISSRSGTDQPRLYPSRLWEVPTSKPSPFEITIAEDPGIISNILSFLGDPVIICQLKMVSRKCRDYIDYQEQRLIRDAVRIGGLNRNVRPSFWLWLTLEKAQQDHSLPLGNATEIERSTDLIELERMGNDEGKWHSVIERDVSRSFGNLPPHKSGARLRTDSIVRALVTWGKSRIVKIGVKGSGNPPPVSANESLEQDYELRPTDTVSDWSGVTNVGSFASSSADMGERILKRNRRRIEPAELALGNAMTDDMKLVLQNKLSFILHALAAVHTDVGYCQGEDYVVAHLLRILQDTIRWKASQGLLPKCIASAARHLPTRQVSSDQLTRVYSEIDRSLVVEETCFRVMNTLFTSYGLRHFYWPELRCLKTSCLVFERLVQAKLPVLADHFEHHELNVGLFALGWFQTMFLYLPSMPSATVCHMWDIFLVERSFKIFFRVGCAILFLSQPILLNHELEGMMCYLNTFPDATLLSPDILIPCALQIKVTNRMLMSLEEDVMHGKAR